MKIFVVDNGGQWTHREWRVLRDLGAETKIIPNTTPLSEIEKENVDGLVLSGGAATVIKETARMGRMREYFDNAKFPMLGMCASHQFMALYYGGQTGPSTIPEFGKTKITVKRDSLIFNGFPKTFIAWESHNDEIKELPDEFEILASSKNCLIQAIQHKEKPFYGLQYHPEVEDTEFGYEIFKNFIEICKKYKSEKIK